MRRDVYNLMVLATACHIPRDEAYDILHQDFIDRFSDYYDSIPEGPEKPTAIDALISFVVTDLALAQDRSGDLRYTLCSSRESIIEMFLHCSSSEMITKLASRNSVLEMVRNYLKRENTQNSMYSKLNSSRVDEVFNGFLHEFQLHYAYAFRFTGTFPDFVMNCFSSFYYRGHKRDIWATLRRADAAKQEVEKSLVQERVITVTRTDDVLIRDLVGNINALNYTLFFHSGQSEDAHGVCYDVYYLLLCELCRRRVDAINKLHGDILTFIDPLDRKDAYGDIKANKGIAAKIDNAKDLVLLVFEYVREGRLNVADLTELRDHCFKLGKNDREGRNCPWKDIAKDGETSRYLDNRWAASNYNTFDLLIKGVVSATTLMTEFEAHGQPLVDSYRQELFNDNRIVRYIDYLSSVPYIDLMRELQDEPVDYSRYGKDLLEFDTMVDVYAGSSVNNHANIRENRYYAITHGFLSKPRLKQTTLLTSRYERLLAFAQCMDTIPRSRVDLLLTLDDNARKAYAGYSFIDIHAGEIVKGKYNSLYTNIFINENKSTALYYLAGDKDKPAKDCLNDLSWHVGSAMYSAIQFGNEYGLYIPSKKSFLFYNLDSITPALVSFEDVLKESANSGYTVQISGEKMPLLLPSEHNILGKHATLKSQSIGFPYVIELGNITSSGVQQRLQKIQIGAIEYNYLQKYLSMMNEASWLQRSLMCMLKTMVTECIYILTVNYGDSRAYKETRYAESLLLSLRDGGFDENALNWFLNQLVKSPPQQNIVLEQFTGTVAYEQADWCALNICFGKMKAGTHGISNHLVEHCSNAGNSPAERFVALYNYVYTQAEFLRYFRDAFSMLLNIVNTDASTLVCELIQRFNLNTWFKEYSSLVVKHGIHTSAQHYDFVKQYVVEVREYCLREFRTMVDELYDYAADCEEELAKLVDYSISARRETSSKFLEIGQVFNMLPNYPDTLQLQELRSKARMDSSGFFIRSGSYFKIKNGGYTYYVHRSGRMVAECNGEFSTVEFDLENSEDDRRRYRDILLAGLSMR